VVIGAVEDVSDGLRVVVVHRARKYQGACNAGCQGEGGGRALGDRAGRPLLDDRLYGVLSQGGQVDADGAVLHQLGLALILVQGLQAATPGRLQDGRHGAGFVARPRVDVEVVVILVDHQQNQPIRGAELSVPSSRRSRSVRPLVEFHSKPPSVQVSLR
jgi:hypothetical protein